MHFLVKDGMVLPIRRSPIRFAVRHKNGLSSKSWIVQAKSSGDAYVMCRDDHSEIKASLHQSGVSRIGFTGESGETMPDGSRVWNEWKCPRLDGDAKIVPLLRILFPDWSLRIPYSNRQSNPSWQKVDCFVETGHDGLLTIITIHQVATNTTVRQGDGINYPIGVLPMGEGRRLIVMANRVPELNLRQAIENSIQSIKPAELGMRYMDDDSTLSMLITGYNGDGTGFMLDTPVEISTGD